MTYYAPTVSYNSGSSATWYTLTGVESVNIVRGRQRFQDAVSQTSMVIQLIPATSYTVPLAIGQPIDCRSSDPSNPGCFFQGRITDIQRVYDLPYNSVSTYAPADRITITATGGLGVMAISELNSFGWTGPTTPEAGINSMTSPTTVNLVYNALSLTAALVSSQTFPNSVSVLEVTNKLLQSGQLTMDDYDVGQSVGGVQLGVCTYPTGFSPFSTTYSDSGAGLKYSTLEFLSSVQNTFNRIEVLPEGLSPSLAVGTGPLNPLRYETYTATQTAADALANYLLLILSLQTQIAPYSIATNTAVEPAAMNEALMVSASNVDPLLGRTVYIVFRGVTYTATTIGLNLSFNIDSASLNWYLTPSLGTPFTLDSSAFGVLDTNRLGFP